MIPSPTSPGIFTAALTYLALFFVPFWVLPPEQAAAVTFAGACGISLLPLFLASTSLPRAELSQAFLAPLLLSSLALVLLYFFEPTTRWTLLVVNGALVSLAHLVGGNIGVRVQHPGHLLPAGCVASAADVFSVFHAKGPSHALAQSQKALSLVTVGFPVPGTPEVAPALGVGDLVFAALVLGVAEAHQLGRGRVAGLLLLGVLVSGGLSAWLGTAVPALPSMVALVLLGTPRARQLLPKDRLAAYSMMVASLVVSATLLLDQR